MNTRERPRYHTWAAMKRPNLPGGAQTRELTRALYPVRRSLLQQSPHLPGGEHCATGIMDRYRADTLTFFATLADSLGVKQRPLSESLGPPGPQTSHSTSSRIDSLDQTPISLHPVFPVFKFPDELILSVLSYVSSRPKPTGHYARFRFQYNMDNNYCHRRRAEFLLPLSMTCRAMRLWLLPWIWEHVEVFSGENLERRPKAIADALRADPCLGMSVKYFRPFIRPWVGADLCSLKVPVDRSFVRIRSPTVRQMPRVTSKSPHARGTMGERVHYGSALERP
jgi:hypothetical protein